MIISDNTNKHQKGKNKMANETLKSYAKGNGVYLWQIADRLGVTDGTFSKYLRKELPPQKKEDILKIIADLKAG
jgi:hypothetical protein